MHIASVEIVFAKSGESDTSIDVKTLKLTGMTWANDGPIYPRDLKLMQIITDAVKAYGT